MPRFCKDCGFAVEHCDCCAVCNLSNCNCLEEAVEPDANLERLSKLLKVARDVSIATGQDGFINHNTVQFDNFFEMLREEIEMEMEEWMMEISISRRDRE